MPTRYQFKVNLFGPDADPQAIGEEIEALIDKRKEHVTAEELIAAARPRVSALHPCFTFDDPLAADKWRKHEARRLTNQLHLADKKDPDKATRTRAFVYGIIPATKGSASSCRPGARWRGPSSASKWSSRPSSSCNGR